MRSRYSAYVQLDERYLLRSWHPSTRPRHVPFDPDLRWVQLEILGSHAGGLLDREGEVEFVAHHERSGRPGTLHEHSRFARHERRWVYVDAAQRRR